MTSTGQWAEHYRPAGPAPPRHHTDVVATDSAPAGAAIADQLTRSRQLHPGWRWSTEQQQLRQLLHAQRHIGRQLDQLTHAGAVVLHARRYPTSAQPVDHIIVTAGAIFTVVDLVASRTEPIGWTSDGHLTQTGISTEPLEIALALGAHAVSATTAELLGPGWTVYVIPIIAIAGPGRTRPPPPAPAP